MVFLGYNLIKIDNLFSNRHTEMKGILAEITVVKG